MDKSCLVGSYGVYGIIVADTLKPDTLIVARKGSPLVIGYGDEEIVVASDASALVQHTRKVTYLEDGEVAVIKDQDVTVKTLSDVEITKVIEELTFDLDQIEKAHSRAIPMSKEIHEQPETI